MSSAYAIRPAVAPRPPRGGGAPARAARQVSTLNAMAATATRGEAAPAEEEARLAHAAAAGDGDAFATLYRRYEGRAYNLAYRVTGSEADAAEATQDAFLNVMRRLPKLGERELAFGSYLFTATRNASYDLIEKRRRARPSEAIPETATPVGTGGAGGVPDPGDPEEDPDRKLLLESQREEIRAANMRLPERQREALALRELEELSYDEIAAIMEMNRNSVAQLISRARINLRDELRGTALAALAAASPECERALPLIAMRDDGQLDRGSEDDAWLDAHLAGCERCRLGVEAMQEAGASYRAWAPIAAAPWLLEETMAKAAELAGADWSEATAAALAARSGAGRLPRRRRRALLAGGIAALLLGGGIATVPAGDEPEPVMAPEQPAAETLPAAEAPAPKTSPQPSKSGKKEKEGKAEPAERTAEQGGETAAATSTLPPSQPPETGAGAGGKPASSRDGKDTSGVQATRSPAGKKPKPQPRPQPAPAPAPAPTPPADPPPPPEEPEESPREPTEPREPPPAGAPRIPRIR